MTASSRRTRRIAAVALLALAWQALLPLAAATLQPRSYATLCTSLGVRVVALDERQAPAGHTTDDHCLLCRIAAPDDPPLPPGGAYARRPPTPAQPVALVTASAPSSGTWSPGSARAPPAA